MQTAKIVYVAIYVILQQSFSRKSVHFEMYSFMLYLDYLTRTLFVHCFSLRFFFKVRNYLFCQFNERINVIAML